MAGPRESEAPGIYEASRRFLDARYGVKDYLDLIGDLEQFFDGLPSLAGKVLQQPRGVCETD